jgi:2-polyprenyl-3-methyl-5-hydroxy-6-metoxy-1,4-benzoquinol methylase
VRFFFRERVIKAEWLDEVGRDRARNSLADLIRLNRYWGGYSSLARLLRSAELPSGPFSVLDIGAANGDMGRRMRKLCPGARVTSLDYVSHHLDGASEPKVVADAFHLPFATKSFDYVFSSLFLHHFTNPQIVELLSSSVSVARRAVFVDDLERAVIPYYFVPATRTLLGWDPITVHDAPISVAAGFRAEELLDLARAAGLRDPVVRTHGIAYRVTLYAPV